MKKNEQVNWLLGTLIIFLLTQGMIVPCGAEGEIQAGAPQLEQQDISLEDMEVIRQMGMLEDMELLNQEDVTFLSKVDEAETISDDEVDHEKK